MDRNQLFICPDNDLEAHTIIEMLKMAGVECLVTGQAWGRLRIN